MGKAQFHYWLRYFIILLVSFIVCMTVSFYIAQTLLLDVQVAQREQAISVLEARQLRAHSNHLVDLVHQFLRRVPDPEAPINASHRQWLSQVFRDELVAYTTLLIDEETDETGYFKELRSVADRVLVMSLHPKNRVIREQALGVVRGLVDEIEDYLTEQGLDERLFEERLSPNWTTG